jgi:phenylacetate-CoA ligase
MITVRGTNVYQTAVENLLAEVPGISMHYELRLTREGDNDVMTVHFEPEKTIAGDRDLWERTAQQAAERIHQALHVRLELKPVEPGSLPRYDLKTKRIVDQRPKEFRRTLDR